MSITKQRVHDRMTETFQQAKYDKQKNFMRQQMSCTELSINRHCFAAKAHRSFGFRFWPVIFPVFHAATESFIGTKYLAATEKFAIPQQYPSSICLRLFSKLPR